MKLKQQICLHALNMLFDRDNTRYVKSILGRHIYTDDDENFDACKVKGNQIFWRVEKADFIKWKWGFLNKISTRHGRWRDTNIDEVITFKVLGNSVEISINEEKKTFLLD